MTLGELISQRRRDWGMTQVQLAKALNVSPAQISALESDRGPLPPPSLLHAIARQLSMTPEAMLFATGYITTLPDPWQEARRQELERQVTILETRISELDRIVGFLIGPEAAEAKAQSS